MNNLNELGDYFKKNNQIGLKRDKGKCFITKDPKDSESHIYETSSELYYVFGRLNVINLSEGKVPCKFFTHNPIYFENFSLQRLEEFQNECLVKFEALNRVLEIMEALPKKQSLKLFIEKLEEFGIKFYKNYISDSYKKLMNIRDQNVKSSFYLEYSGASVCMGVEDIKASEIKGLLEEMKEAYSQRLALIEYLN